ncbi:LytTR family DNA-binding domain-containing protein [Aureibaculum sp. 2210JD6-5]|uniref:LytR/AlgR family response regulator transcription factor n=1 Tax=Aureibaculum sp. 2210JD6-5 TaxID=3103957 RepID=UPI002AACD533|nr:LytTR family DNA-binding domain-containing protein [Aureibaculum sp. 2210JD6-5]MDY7395859.1 LytTR family DNA-binding domain-containing protein [Aureibaculum sp. 2210JD6-5]
MIKALIVEDEQYIRKGLISMVQSLEKGIDITGECESVKDAVTVTKACKPDLIFLDINLTDGNAFDFLDQTEELTFKVIFITAYEQYALQAIKNGAVDYILKPVDIDELENAIDKALVSDAGTQKEQLQVVKNQLIDNKKTKLVLRLQEGYQVIEFQSLVYCQSDKGYTTFYLSNGKSYIASKPIKEFEGLLPVKNFIRTHQSYIVNLDYIDKYDKAGYIYLKSGTRIPVASRRKEEFVAKLLGE